MSAIITTNLEHIAFIDIETVTKYKNILGAPFPYNAMWSQRSDKLYPGEMVAKTYTEKAALHPEFSQVCCVSLGYFEVNNGTILNLKVKSFVGSNEIDIMKGVNDALVSSYYRQMVLCGHNGRGFDVPFLAKRYLINDLKIPGKINFSGKKPWEIDFLDTYEIWKFGGMGSASLDLICFALGLPSPKEASSGDQVHGMYFRGEFDAIANYCAGDVSSVAQIVCKMKNTPINYRVNHQIVTL